MNCCRSVNLMETMLPCQMSDFADEMVSSARTYWSCRTIGRFSCIRGTEAESGWLSTTLNRPNRPIQRARIEKLSHAEGVSKQT